MTKRDEKNYRDYWVGVHSQHEDDLAAVIHPEKPAYFNRFAAWMQKYALNKTIRGENLTFNKRRLLDIGCGRGRWLRYFTHLGADATGIDLSLHAVAACHHHGLKAHQASATHLPFADASFDYVTSITVLLHLPPNLKTLAIAEIARVLKPKGKIIMIESTWDDPADHVFGQRLDAWEALFRDNGLVIQHASGHYFNYFRFRYRLPFLPYRLKDLIGTVLDYPLEYVLMNYFYNRRTSHSLQHLLVVEKV